MENMEEKQQSECSLLLLEIKAFYNQIVDETVELMNLYGCKKPLEIYCLFNLINNYYVNEDELFNLLYMKDKPLYPEE